MLPAAEQGDGGGGGGRDGRRAPQAGGQAGAWQARVRSPLPALLLAWQGPLEVRVGRSLRQPQAEPGWRAPRAARSRQQAERPGGRDSQSQSQASKSGSASNSKLHRGWGASQTKGAPTCRAEQTAAVRPGGGAQWQWRQAAAPPPHRTAPQWHWPWCVTSAIVGAGPGVPAAAEAIGGGGKRGTAVLGGVPCTTN